MSWAAIQATDSRSTSACSLASSLSASWAAVILALSAIVVSPFVALLEQTDDHEARDGRTHIGHAALLHHDPRLDQPKLVARYGKQQAAKRLGGSRKDYMNAWIPASLMSWTISSPT